MEPQDKLKHPQVWNFDVNTPDLFSFPAILAYFNDKKTKKFLNLINSLEPVINKIAQGKKIKIYSSYSIKQTCQKLQKIVRLTQKGNNYNPILYVKANLCLFFCDGIASTTENDKQYLKAVLNFKVKTLCPELCWYRAVAINLYYQDTQDKSIALEQLLEILQFIKSNFSTHFSKYRDAILYFALKFSEQSTAYPDVNFFKRLKQLTPVEKPWDYDGVCTRLRHDFTTNHVKNSTYFTSYENLMIDAAETNTQKIVINIPANECLTLSKKSLIINISNKRLFKYIAHIIPPSPPIPKIIFSKASSEEIEQFNIGFRRLLRQKGLCNSEGFLLKEALNKLNFPTVQLCLAGTLTDRNLRLAVDQTSEEWIEKKFLYDNFKADYDKLTKLSDFLAGFSTIDALTLFRENLIQQKYGLPPKLLQKIKRSVSFCLEIAFEADNIAKDINISDPIKHKKWFELASKIVQHLQAKKESLIIAVGTPKGKEDFSEHAIYVAFKYISDSQKYQVIITNGGLGVSKFHIKSNLVAAKDREEYCYAAFKPFDLVHEKMLEALQHYIYKLICLEFTPSDKDPAQCDGKNEFEFDNLFRNVYLRTTNSTDTEEYFYGNLAVNPNKITVFERMDLIECLRVQFAGNCTIHNLKQALAILFDMDRVMFGLLEDNIVLGLDDFISQHEISSVQQNAIVDEKKDGVNQRLLMENDTSASFFHHEKKCTNNVVLQDTKSAATLLKIDP